MMRSGVILMVVAVGVFVSSSFIYAISGSGAPRGLPMSKSSSQLAAMTQLSLPGLPALPLAPALPGLDLYSPFLRPENPLLWMLLVAVWLALIVHAITVLRLQVQVEHRLPVDIGPLPQGRAEAGPPSPQQLAEWHRLDNLPSEHAPLALALLAGAIWPWIIDTHQAAGFIMAVAMLSLALAAAIRGQRDGGAIRRKQTVGLFAGWATAVTYGAFATLLHNHLGVPVVASIATAMLLCASAGVITQLRLGSVFSYSVAIIWSLVGLALITMSADATIAMVAIVAITAMAIVLVRVAS